MKKRINEKEFTKMVYDKLHEDNREVIYDNVYWTVRYMLRTMADILKNGDKLLLSGYFTVEIKYRPGKTMYSGLVKQEVVVPGKYYPYFKIGDHLERVCEEYGEQLEREKEEAEEYEDDEM